MNTPLRGNWHEFSCDIRDPDTGLVLFHDVECMVDVSAEFDEAVGVTMSIIGVRMFAEESGVSRRKRMKEMGHDRLPPAHGEWIDLMRSKLALHQQIAAYIVAEAEEDDGLAEKIMVEEGIVYRGLGGNDPDGHFRRAR